MKIEVTNIPKEKFDILSQEVCRVLVKQGIMDFDQLAIVDGKDNYIGCEYEIE